MVDRFIASFKRAPKRLILDFDATDDAVHGRQDGRFFHGYYDHYCFLPLYVFCRDQLLVSYLRPSKIDGAKHAWAILALLVKRLRQAWPKVRIILRGDSGFCRWRMLAWCERHKLGYIVGIAKNKRLNRRAQPALERAAVVSANRPQSPSVRCVRLCRRHLGPATPGDCQGRAYRQGRQSPLCGHQSGGRALGPV